MLSARFTSMKRPIFRGDGTKKFVRTFFEFQEASTIQMLLGAFYLSYQIFNSISHFLWKSEGPKKMWVRLDSDKYYMPL